jgi:hypothetical protein
MHSESFSSKSEHCSASTGYELYIQSKLTISYGSECNNKKHDQT